MLLGYNDVRSYDEEQVNANMYTALGANVRAY